MTGLEVEEEFEYEGLTTTSLPVSTRTYDPVSLSF
jgi:hypothetical protein